MRFTSLILLYCILWGTVISGTTPVALAQDQTADSTVALPEIEIVGLRAGTSLAHAPARISIHDANAIESSASNTLAELLGRMGNGFVRSYGSGLANISFRGTSSSQTLLLLDGIPLSDPQLGQLDLSLIPLPIVEEIQILHGAGSAFYGSQSMGGAINLRTVQPNEPLSILAAANAGPFDERGGHLAISSAHERWSGTLSVSRQELQGDFPYLNLSLFPPQTSRREGADRQHTSIWGKLTRTAARNTLTFSAWINDVERGLPGVSTATPKDERQWDQNRRLQARHLSSSRLGVISLTAALQQNELRYFNPQIDIDQAGSTDAATLEAELSSSNLSTDDLPVELSTGLSANRYTARHPSLNDQAGETHLAWFARGEIQKSAIRLFPAIRIDAHLPTSGNQIVAINPSFGLNITPVAGWPLHLKSRVSRAFRAPTFNDRFWQPGGNPSLNPEHGWNYEAGLVVNHSTIGRTVFLEVAGFHHETANQIIWTPKAGENYWAPENIGKTRATGFEASSAIQIPFSTRSALHLASDYTLVHARDVSDVSQPSFNQPLRYTPKHVFSFRPTFTAQVKQITWKLSAAARHVSRRFITTDGSQDLPAYFTADVHLNATRALGRTSISAGFFVENIFDASYEVVKGYPVPPRALHIRLAARFNGSK